MFAAVLVAFAESPDPERAADCADLGAASRTDAGSGTTSGTGIEKRDRDLRLKTQSGTGSESVTITLEFLPCGALYRLVDPNFLFKPDGFSGTGP